MNDRYLYRAKRTDNGELVEGNLVWFDDVDDDYKAIIIPTTDSGMFTKGGARGNLGFENWFRVDPSTICQCTGLKDKNGKLIWENDNCMVGRPCVFAYGTIKYLEGCFCFVEDKTENLLRLCDLRTNGYEIKVKSNVFDNPELFEVES